MKQTIPHGEVLSKFVKTKSWSYFHIYTDRKDEYIPYDALSDNPNYQESYRKALDLAGEWIMGGAQNIRVWRVEESEDYRDGSINQDKEELILSIGDPPE